LISFEYIYIYQLLIYIIIIMHSSKETRLCIRGGVSRKTIKHSFKVNFCCPIRWWRPSFSFSGPLPCTLVPYG